MTLSLFFTIAAIIIDSQFSDLLDDTVHENLLKAMHIAVTGDGYRVFDYFVDEENLQPAYSNVSSDNRTQAGLC